MDPWCAGGWTFHLELGPQRHAFARHHHRHVLSLGRPLGGQVDVLCNVLWVEDAEQGRARQHRNVTLPRDGHERPSILERVRGREKDQILGRRHHLRHGHIPPGGLSRVLVLGPSPYDRAEEVQLSQKANHPVLPVAHNERTDAMLVHALHSLRDQVVLAHKPWSVVLCELQHIKCSYHGLLGRLFLTTALAGKRAARSIHRW
eukprot:scaffold12646_cov115-Isochrysis_galbana.AAC.11